MYLHFLALAQLYWKTTIITEQFLTHRAQSEKTNLYLVTAYHSWRSKVNCGISHNQTSV